MKTPIISTVLRVMLFTTVLFMACHHEQVQQFTIDLQYGDGTKESYAMVAGSMLLVNEGDLHVVAKIISGSKNDMEMQVARYNMTHDSIKGMHTIQKVSANTNRFAMAKNSLLDPTGTVQVILQSMAMIDTGRRPKGACQGNCCEAKCFSTFCCSDPDECNNVPCNCQPPSNCPGQPTGGQTSHFFQLFMSGKNMVAFKD